MGIRFTVGTDLSKLKKNGLTCGLAKESGRMELIYEQRNEIDLNFLRMDKGWM